MKRRSIIAALAAAGLTLAAAPAFAQSKYQAEYRLSTVVGSAFPWGKAGENIAKYCTKGRPLFVEGRLRLDQWEDKNTKEKRSRMKVVCENFQFLGSGSGARSENGGGEGGEGRTYNAPAPRSAAPSRPAPAQQENLDEDVPF